MNMTGVTPKPICRGRHLLRHDIFEIIETLEQPDGVIVEWLLTRSSSDKARVA